MLKRRRVFEAERVPHGWVLALECGHSVPRPGKGKSEPPKSTACEKCEIALDRLEQIPDRGFCEARKLRETYRVLKFLEAEGYVRSSPCIRGNTIYWARSALER